MDLFSSFTKLIYSNQYLRLEITVVYTVYIYIDYIGHLKNRDIHAYMYMWADSILKGGLSADAPAPHPGPCLHLLNFISLL